MIHESFNFYEFCGFNKITSSLCSACNIIISLLDDSMFINNIKQRQNFNFYLNKKMFMGFLLFFNVYGFFKLFFNVSGFLFFFFFFLFLFVKVFLKFFEFFFVFHSHDSRTFAWRFWCCLPYFPKPIILVNYLDFSFYTKF